jgi:hypothetical protein
MVGGLHQPPPAANVNVVWPPVVPSLNEAVFGQPEAPQLVWQPIYCSVGPAVVDPLDEPASEK